MDIVFLGGDKRQLYAARELSHYFTIYALGLGDEFPAPQGECAAAVLPIPVTRDGANFNAPLSPQAIPINGAERYIQSGAAVFAGGCPPALCALCEKRALRLYDLLSDEDFALKNAQLTAESAIALLAQSTDGSVYGARALVTGYGRCAMYAARLLRALGARVTVCARSPRQRALAELDGHFAASLDGLKAAAGCADFIINTVPTKLFGEGEFGAAKRGAVFMELASLPAEPAGTLAENAGLKYIHAGGLPGKYSPNTAGELIAKHVIAALGCPQDY